MPRRKGGTAAQAGPSGGRGIPIRLVLVDDQRLVREGLREILSRRAEIVVAGEAPTAAMALAECHRVRPDVLLVDALLPEMAAFSLIRQVRGAYPETEVVALVECDHLQCLLRPPGSLSRARCWFVSNGENGRQQCVELALQAGAHGVLRKTQSPQELLHAIEATASGERWMESKTAARPMSPGQDSPAAADPGMHEGLTRREVEIIREILSGCSNKEIARTLGLREQTVKNAVSRVLHKLHLHDRVQIALHALETRLLERYASLLP
jgi:NarL family two-component system response regulator LiaR